MKLNLVCRRKRKKVSFFFLKDKFTLFACLFISQGQQKFWIKFYIWVVDSGYFVKLFGMNSDFLGSGRREFFEKVVWKATGKERERESESKRESEREI